MIIIKYLNTLKKYIPQYDKCSSFLEVLNFANNVNFPQKEYILKHFNTITINESEDKSLCILKYNTKYMMKNNWDDFYKITRGITINWKKCEVVMYPFDKFFELNEHSSTKINIVKKLYDSTDYVEVTEKIDGSLIMIRYYNGEYLISSSGQLKGIHVDIARDILFKNNKYLKFIKDFSNYTIILEMKNTLYHNLIKYNKNDLTIIGMRDMSDFKLLNRKEILELIKGYEVSLVKTYEYSLKELLQIIIKSDLPPIEGYIMRINDFMVKFKTINFILANRYMGDPTRNFNMIVQAFNDYRVDYIRPLIRKDYLQAFDLQVDIFRLYINKKIETLNSINKELGHLDNKDYIVEFKNKYPNIRKNAINICINNKNGYDKVLNKEDIDYLKGFSKYFGCVNHIKYAELNNIPLYKVEDDIKKGILKYLIEYTDKDNNKIYIIHKWQFLNVENIKYQL